MRVAILTANARAGDAIGQQVVEKLTFFLDRGADVRVFAENVRSPHPAVRPHCEPINPSHPSAESWKFLANSDLVIAEYGHGYPLLGLLPLLAGNRPRILLDYHGVTPPSLWGSQNREALEAGVRQRGLVWCADGVMVHSRFTRRELLEPTGYPSERCVTLPLPVADAFFQLSEGARRECFDFGEATVLLFVGRLAPNKRAPLLIEALDRLRDRKPPVHAVFVGDDRDIYQFEKQKCQEKATQLGLAERVHFLGKVSSDRLREAYRAADVLVMPSRHEGFCLPVVEAMAGGLPVVAARAGALPETVGNAGLTFQPDDPDDLARQLRCVLDETRSESKANKPLRVAVVASRYGADFVGGAETSLRTMAEALHQAGHRVEVFTICERGNANEGRAEMGGVAVHRFALDDRNSAQFQEAARVIAQADGPVGEESERAFLRHSIRSTQLVEALRRRAEQFDAIITGPYLSGLSFEVARTFAGKTLLAPCFHDEPLARLRAWRPVYERVGGMLFHSPEEQTLAEAEFGYNSPGGECVGTFLSTEVAGEAARGRQLVGAERYLVYCGRYLAEKGFALLIEYARRYSAERPGRFTFAFMGQGELAVPRVAWARDLGFVAESVKRDVLAGAEALVHLSPNESLSLAVLEAWSQGVPVLTEARCEVLAGHLRRSGGGQMVDSYETFAAWLDDLWANPGHWRALGLQGRDYVRTRYGSQAALLRTLEDAIRSLPIPLIERMRRRGLERAAGFNRQRWRERFGALVEEILDRPAHPSRLHIEINPRHETRIASGREDTILIPVRVTNRGTRPAVAEGPARVVLRSEVVEASGGSRNSEKCETSLAGLLMPGQTLAAAIPVKVPTQPGIYEALFRAVVPEEAFADPEREKAPSAEGLGEGDHGAAPTGKLRLIVTGNPQAAALDTGFSLGETVQTTLAEAERLGQLPDDYTDVTQGVLASWKAWIKRKLLGNFKRAYVDVLSRRQSAFNRRMLTAFQELMEYCATRESACRRDRERIRALEEQLARLKQGDKVTR